MTNGTANFVWDIGIVHVSWVRPKAPSTCLLCSASFSHDKRKSNFEKAKDKKRKIVKKQIQYLKV